MDTPLFSIIIPTLNSEALLKRCLESVLNQSFADIEILLIDGLSRDKTLQIAHQFADNRIRIITDNDKGIFDAMNKGIGIAKGEWLYFLGSDDRLYTNETLEHVIPFCTDTVEVLYGDIFSARLKGVHDGEFTESKILKKNICHQAIFFKRSVFSKIGMFDLKYKAHADWDHNMRWFLSGKVNYKYINQIIAEYADGGFSSVTQDLSFKKDRILKYIAYSGKRLSKNKRIFLLLRELKRLLIKGNYKIFFSVLLQLPKIVINIGGRAVIKNMIIGQSLLL